MKGVFILIVAYESRSIRGGERLATTPDIGKSALTRLTLRRHVLGQHTPKCR